MNKERNLKELFFLFVKKITCNSENENISNKETKKYELKINGAHITCTSVCMSKLHASVLLKIN